MKIWPFWLKMSKSRQIFQNYSKNQKPVLRLTSVFANISSDLVHFWGS